MAQATTLKPGQFRHLLRVTTATSRHPERDLVILLLGIMCGMRVSEIAQIEVADLLHPALSRRNAACGLRSRRDAAKDAFT
ncbi:hypothetical protein [Massilia sp. CCM 8734]|uniref:hypothetical protein n=1 Tax=Massilia sp. CCM 8734 TaxID=2609283 RepID=UPI001E63BD86|nr:hypothetical protein [Massilia sp. CCM 8734]